MAGEEEKVTQSTAKHECSKSGKPDDGFLFSFTTEKAQTCENQTDKHKSFWCLCFPSTGQVNVKFNGIFKGTEVSKEKGTQSTSDTASTGMGRNVMNHQVCCANQPAVEVTHLRMHKTGQ